MFPYVVDERGEPLRLGLAHAGGRLVEQQHRGAGAQAADDFQVAQLAEGQVAGVRAGPVRQADRTQQAQRLGFQPFFFRAEHGRTYGGPQRPRVSLDVQAGQHVLQHRQAGYRAWLLERPRDARAHQLVRCRADQFPVAVGDRAGVGRDEPAEDPERGRLARAVGAHQAVHLARLDGEGGVGYRLDPAVLLGDPADHECVIHWPALPPHGQLHWRPHCSPPGPGVCRGSRRNAR